MSLQGRWSGVLRSFGAGLLIQALLSGTNFAVGLILVRRASDLQYSYYVLAINGLLLLTSLQTSFIQPYIVNNITRLELDGRRDLLGGLIRTNHRWVPPLCAAGILLTLGAWMTGLLSQQEMLLIALTILAAGISLGRELFRMTLFAYRRPENVLRADIGYAALLLCGAWLASLTSQPAPAAVAAVAVAALVSRLLLGRSLWQHERWNTTSQEHVLGKIARMGLWAVTGAGIHWLLIQGYGYLVAGVLDVQHVAAIAATRLTLMPVFVLSGGISMLLFPMTARWVHDLGAGTAARRLIVLTLGLVAVALIYMFVMWQARDWIYTVILKKSFAQRDKLLLLWSAVFIVTLARDQLATLPAARQRFRDMTLMTSVCAAVWLVASYGGMFYLGAPGAVVGILAGETLNILGLIVMIFQETRSPGAVKTAATRV